MRRLDRVQPATKPVHHRPGKKRRSLSIKPFMLPEPTVVLLDIPGFRDMSMSGCEGSRRWPCQHLLRISAKFMA
jgi:hypothetical protein